MMLAVGLFAVSAVWKDCLFGPSLPLILLTKKKHV